SLRENPREEVIRFRRSLKAFSWQSSKALSWEIATCRAITETRMRLLGALQLRKPGRLLRASQ
ncbi:MAG: hypothetical protein ACTHKY_12600, partial [Ginsengibacter sp.]